MEDIFYALVLGALQGLTEFLPISSSGHLIIVHALLAWDMGAGLTFDVALHLGTSAALLLFFWREWWQMLSRGLLFLRKGGGLAPSPHERYDHRLLFLIALGSMPAAVAGLLLDAYAEETFRSPVLASAMLVLFGLVLFVCEKLGAQRRGIEESTWRDAVWIGCAQALALVPGVSRSGVTISAALLRGFSRPEAARFSFLLATPVTVGAGVFKLLQALLAGISAAEVLVIALGMCAAAAVGWAAIRYLLHHLETHSYTPFVVYRLVVGLIALVYFSR